MPQLAVAATQDYFVRANRPFFSCADAVWQTFLLGLCVYQTVMINLARRATSYPTLTYGDDTTSTIPMQQEHAAMLFIATR